jgi:hypothetical protein
MYPKTFEVAHMASCVKQLLRNFRLEPKDSNMVKSRQYFTPLIDHSSLVRQIPGLGACDAESISVPAFVPIENGLRRAVLYPEVNRLFARHLPNLTSAK